MHHKAFDGQAPVEPAGGAYNTTPDPLYFLYNAPAQFENIVWIEKWFWCKV